jgi:uncharacterized protein (TIGR02680 family)
MPDDLAAWRTQLEESDTVLKARLRSANVLDGRLREAIDAETKATGLREKSEDLDASLNEARERAGQRGADLLGAASQYAAQVTAWAARLPDPVPVTALVGMPPDEELPSAERALARDIPDAVVQAAHDVAQPVLADYESQRDQALEDERSVIADLETARRERHRWETQTEAEPSRSPYSSAERPPGTGAPLFLLADFHESVPRADQAGIEAALEASGLLAAWLAADGTLLAPDSRDVIAQASDPVTGPSLADVLRPVPGHGIGEAVLDRLLHSIGLAPDAGEPDAKTWIARDGRYRLDVLRGAHGKDQAEYIGAAIRAQTRQRRLDELTRQIGGLETKLDRATTTRREIEAHRDALQAALREIPGGRALAAAWSAYDHASGETTRLADLLLKARRAAEQATAAAAALRTRAEAQATSDGLPAISEKLAQLQRDLTSLRKDLDTMVETAARVTRSLAAHATARISWQRARQARTEAEAGFVIAQAKLTGAQRELALLESSVGASEQEIMARETDARSRLDAAERALPGARSQYNSAHDERLKAEAQRDRLIEELAEQERSVVAGGSALRRPLGLPGLPLAAGLAGVDAPLDRYDAAQDGDVRARIGALRALADDIAVMLGPVSADVTPSLIIKRGEELRDGLAGGYDAEGDEADGIKRYLLRDDTGRHDVAVVGERIRSAAEAAADRLSAREQEVFETYLLGELGDHLSRQVLAARNLVTTMSDTLEQVRSSHGIGVRLEWDLPRDGDADVRAAVTLLRQASAARARDQSAQLRDALRGRIEDARRADPSAGYAVHLRTALDYRDWFEFRVKVTEAAHPDRERMLSHRTALSQGEMRVVSYLVLFATAAAHFTSVAASAPQAPRLILLDDAFAKVDEPTHGRLLGLLVDLDLDFVITSERLWGCFATVPSLHIYECLRDPGQRGVATVHFTWDGHHKHLVGV